VSQACFIDDALHKVVWQHCSGVVDKLTAYDKRSEFQSVQFLHLIHKWKIIFEQLQGINGELIATLLRDLRQHYNN